MIARLLLLSCLLACSHVQADPFALIISGSGGEAEYAQRFKDWGQHLQHTLTHELAYPANRVQLLTAPTDSLTQIDAAISQLLPQLQPDDQLFVFLIGHGSYRNNIAKLNIPGPDLSAIHLDSLLAPVRRLAIINTASQSAAFINAFSGSNRILCTSTKSVAERNAPWFMQHFIAALADGHADQNRDERISIFEACQQAAALTHAHYQSSGNLITEHALLDDDGDGLGSRLYPYAPGSGDGPLAQQVYLRDLQLNAPAELIEAYRQAIDKVEALIENKQTMDEGVYYRQLEALLLEAAQHNRRIHQTDH